MGHSPEMEVKIKTKKKLQFKKENCVSFVLEGGRMLFLVTGWLICHLYPVDIEHKTKHKQGRQREKHAFRWEGAGERERAKGIECQCEFN